MIRKLEPTDAEQYFTLRLEALKENPEAFAASYEEEKETPIKIYEERFQNPNQYTFGAFNEGRLVGMVSLVPEVRGKLKHKVNIFAMYVTPEFRRNGIGYELMQAAINQAKELDGVIRINLTVVSVNHEAKALYKKFGFETYGLEEKALKVKNVYFDEEYMSLTL